MGADFPGEEIKLGHFSEMVSAHAENRDYFRLGMMESLPGRKKRTIAARGVLLTYTEERGQPKISHLTCSFGNRDVTLRVSGDRTFFKSVPAAPYTSPDDLKDRLVSWAADHAAGGAGLREFRLPKGMSSAQVPLAMVLSMAVRFSSVKKESDQESFSFFVPQFGPPVVWIAPIRTAPRRTYDEPHTVFSPEGQHTPYLIRRMLNSDREATKFGEFIGRVGKSSGLFEKIEIKYFGNKTDPTSPFEVDAHLDNKALSLGWLGYGVSQSLPILVELLDRPKRSWFAIQQPEVHLHPRAQASLGDVFFEMADGDQKTFLIETHSDFTIDRFRLNYRRKRSKKVPAGQVLFFERRNGCNTVTPVPIDSHGDLSSDQPQGYRDFFVKEQMSLLGR